MKCKQYQFGHFLPECIILRIDYLHTKADDFIRTLTKTNQTAFLFQNGTPHTFKIFNVVLIENPVWKNWIIQSSHQLDLILFC